MGASTDTILVRADDLRPVHRRMQQGPARVTLDYGETRIGGEMSVPGQPKSPITVAIGEPVVGHLETELATMPLAVGFETQLRAFQPAMGSVQLVHLAVAAAESVETGAGTFDVYRVELSGDDGSSMQAWVTRTKPHRTVKTELAQPAMGGARVVSVLAAVE